MLACPLLWCQGHSPPREHRPKLPPRLWQRLPTNCQGGKGQPRVGTARLCATHPNTVWVVQTAKLPKAPAMARGDLGMRESAIRAPRDFPFIRGAKLQSLHPQRASPMSPSDEQSTLKDFPVPSNRSFSIFQPPNFSDCRSQPSHLQLDFWRNILLFESSGHLFLRLNRRNIYIQQ